MNDLVWPKLVMFHNMYYNPRSSSEESSEEGG